MGNKVEFRHFIDRWPRPTGDVVTMAAHIVTPSGKTFLVVFHDKATIEGWDAVEIRRVSPDGEIQGGEFTLSWLKDKHEDDMFASELFGELTGKYPYQIRETVKAELNRHPCLNERLESDTVRIDSTIYGTMARDA